MHHDTCNSNEMNGILPTPAPGLAHPPPNKPECDRDKTDATRRASPDVNAAVAGDNCNDDKSTPAVDGADCKHADTGIPSAVGSSLQPITRAADPAGPSNPGASCQIDCSSSTRDVAPLGGHSHPAALPSTDATCNGLDTDDDGMLRQPTPSPAPSLESQTHQADHQRRQQRDSLGQLSQLSTDKRHKRGPGLIVRRFQKFDAEALSSAPSPDVKIGQRVAYKEYYGNEFGTIRWIGRVPQISPDWTVGVEFDNAIGEGDGSLNGRRYFIAKDCFAKFLPLMAVALVDQHVGRPEPGTMISVMSAAVRPGQMISIQRVSTVHVQHCFLNAPHRRPGAEFLAVNTRLHCQCPSCGPCAHVVKPPRTQRLMTPKNATHMCQFSTYTCCGMESSDEALCTYTGNKISSQAPPTFGHASIYGSSLPPLGNSWMEGSGYLTNLQAEQRKLMPEEYRLGAAPEDTLAGALLRRNSSGRRHQQRPRSPTGSQPHAAGHSTDPHAPYACDRSAQASPALDKPPGSQSTELRPLASEHRHRHRHHHHHHHHRRHHDGHHHHQSQHRARRSKSEEGRMESPVYANLDPREARRIADDIAGRAIDMQGAQQSGREQGMRINSRDGEAATTLDDESLRPFELVKSQQPDMEEQLATARDMNGQNAPVNNILETGQLEEAELLAGGGGKHQAHRQDNNNHDDDDDDDHEGRDLEAATATRAVQYRDSIENRYLFPTDDVIDSTLEADLETLSQARYGRFGGARSSVSNCSSESSRRWPRRGRRQRQRRQRRNNRRKRRGRSHEDYRRGRGPSPKGLASDFDDDDDDDDDYDGGRADGQERNPIPAAIRRNIIVKGLRSLVVSCLSANEHHSAATTPTNKSNSNHHHQHHHHRHQQSCGHRSGHQTPGDYANVATAGELECCCRHEESMTPTAMMAQFGQSDYYGNGEQRHATNEIVASHRQVDQLNLNKASMGFVSWSAEEEINANYYMNLEPSAVAAERCEFDFDDAFECDIRDGHPRQHAARSSHRHHHHHHHHQEQQQSQRWHRHTAASPDDPHQHPNAESNDGHPSKNSRHQISSSSDCGFSSASQNSMNLTNNSNPGFSPAKFSGEEQRRLGQIYQRLAARLAGNGTLVNGAGGALLDDETSDGRHGEPAVSATSEDLFRLKRALIEIHSEGCCQNTRCPSPRGDETSRAVHVKPETALDVSGGGADTDQRRVPPKDDPDEPKRALARAFELKLTLSINPDPTTVPADSSSLAAMKSATVTDHQPATAVKSNGAQTHLSMKSEVEPTN